MYRPTDLGYLVQLDPTKARRLLLRELRKAGGDNEVAAANLGVHRATIKRWVQRLGIRPELERIRRRQGQEHAASEPAVA